MSHAYRVKDKKEVHIIFFCVTFTVKACLVQLLAAECFGSIAEIHQNENRVCDSEYLTVLIRILISLGRM